MDVYALMETLDEIAPFKDSASWDNTGLLVGDGNTEVTGVLTTLDCHPETVDEAIEHKLNVIVAHHPVIFPKISAVTEKGIGPVIRKLIKNDVNLIVMHTNLDHQPHGVSHMIAEKLGYTETNTLISHKESYRKLRINIPRESVEQLKSDLAEVGVGEQGDYSDCFFEYPVKGQFRPGRDADPHTGKNNELKTTDEYVVEAIFEASEEQKVINTLYKTHPYEEPAYDIISLHKRGEKGLGVSFEFEGSLEDLVSTIETKTGLAAVNIVKGNNHPIKKVALIGGSGMSYIDQAFKEGADVLITGDVKYHEAYDARLIGRNIIDTGHYMEYVMADGLKELIDEKIELNVQSTEVSTNPFS
ncbi:Nif3-like dinuclear metal center hexameric protein [Salinicoccus albus]|uniref:Nif3-like dinuclear metal center hexameric protein n=1 Tax=Salinicoccus albus TaxID=418756 RepID=UPI000369534D|nr:Nif3-like dinuclear metal center hexameric protein [Salinicoccus albus]